LLPFNVENGEKKKTLDLLLREKLNRQKKTKTIKRSADQTVVGRTRKKKSQRTRLKQDVVSGNDNDGNEREERNAKMNLKIPFNLQKQLVADWERIHKNELLSLPCSPCVVDILEKWGAKERRKKHTPTAQNTIQILIRGLTDFFDSALSRCLLYDFERQQHEEELKKFKSKNRRDKKKIFKASKVYGAEHFLRLFVKLPDLFADMDVSDEDHQFFQPQVVDILKFLSKSSSSMFSKAYEPADERYVAAFRKRQDETVF